MEFNVGDRVRIRQWEDMEKEFGLDIDGDIQCYSSFAPGMRHLCGKIFTIETIYGNGIVKFYDFSERWNISTEMIEKVEETKKSRSEYQTEYRKRKKTVQFNTSIPTEYDTKLKKYLISQGMSKTEWVVKMIKQTLDID